ncbi:hypothetical protein CYMTET_56021 [Cymbomonas tetramitiformis]|uniref:Uncharacterized protein n=1 Tax=Cymbomonas tetramitiformis TaxID=36881 RepID=A0AAE0BD83_9CHLO|nr:hypothetical protein CYMTET_56021 [Cymbomonas tetramitiformis]
MLGASKLAVFDDNGHFSFALAQTLVTDIQLSSPVPTDFLTHLMSFIAELPQIVMQEQSFQLFSESTRQQLVAIFRGFLEPQSALYLAEHAPILSDLFVESVTYFLEPVNSVLFGVGCPGTRDNVRCGRTECKCVQSYLRNPTSLTFGTCGLLSCAQNRLASQLTGNALKRTRRNFCALAQKLPYCLPISCSGDSSSYERCRLCSMTLHRSCALNIFSEGNYAFPLDAGSQLFCSQCIITLPQVVAIFATVASTLANTGAPLEYLVVVPTHTTEAAELHLRALQDAAESFEGIKFAWLGDVEGEKEFFGLSGTPVAQRDPERATMMALREELRHSVQRERDLRATHAESAHTSEAGDTPGGSIPEGNYGYSPVAALQASLSGAAQPALGVTHPSHGVPTVGVAPTSLQPHPLGELAVELQLAQGKPVIYPPGAYIPPHLRPTSTTLAPIPVPQQAIPPSVVNPQPVTAGCLPAAAAPARGVASMIPSSCSVLATVVDSADVAATVSDSVTVPPRKFASEEARRDHAARQMTYHDTADGLYEPGVRYSELLYEHFLPSEQSLLEGCRSGYRMSFVSKPPRFQLDNHPSCYEFADRSQKDLERSARAGVLEGPLHYEPWSVTQIGSIYIPEKDKFRNVWNGRSSGVNRSMAPASARYDYLEDILSLQRPGCYMSGWDLKDAFWNNPRWQPHCDYG